MLNYVKSELYRASRSPEIRETAAVFVGLVLLMNIVLCLLKGLEDFRYGITSFSYSNVVAMPMIFCYVASDVAVMLYESDRRNRTEQNCISYGMSRLELLAGKCIVSLAVSFVILVMILPVYICSAELLLDSAGPTTAADLLLELPAMSLIAIASLVLANVLLEVFDKSIVSILVWLAVLVFLPKILLLAGMALTKLPEFEAFRLREFDSSAGYRPVDARKFPHGAVPGQHVRVRRYMGHGTGDGEMPDCRRGGNRGLWRFRRGFIAEAGTLTPDFVPPGCLPGGTGKSKIFILNALPCTQSVCFKHIFSRQSDSEKGVSGLYL